MPLGNHTSQFFANVYLNELDQFVKHKLKVKHYIRYVDDFVILSRNRKVLEDYQKQINFFLESELKLQIHPDKSYILNLRRGVSFLGYKIFYHNRLLKRKNVLTFEKRMRELRILYHEHQVSRDKVVEKLEGWLAYAGHADTYSYRRNVLRNFNRFFPYRIEKEKLSKKSRNFYKKVALSKVEFSTQKTLALIKQGLSFEQVAHVRGVKIGTIWNHVADLIEHGWLSVWNIIPKKRIVFILQRIKSHEESLKDIRSRVQNLNITYDEIACVKAHLKMKENIRKKYRKARTLNYSRP